MRRTRRGFLKTAGMCGAAAFLTPALSCAGARDPRGPFAPGKRPNILWLYIEDMNPLLGCYGDSRAVTPNMDRLAANGVLFENAFVPVPVCSPCRSSIITGAMATTIGAHNHRSSRGEERIDLLPGVTTLPEIFREAGYYTYNRGKDDYNFAYDRGQLYAKQADWSGRAEGQPFFGQIQMHGGKYVLGKPFKNRKWRIDHDVAAETLPPYYPKHPVMVKHWAMHYDAVKMNDDAVGEIIGRLEKDGLLDDTIIFCFSDHGCYLPRDKQFCYDGGLHVPLIVSHLGGKPPFKRGARRKDLVSLLDITATSLGLAGLEAPAYMESRDLFAPDHKKRAFIVATRDRCDFTIDRIRAVRTSGFKYIRNFMTDRPYTQPQYRDGREYMDAMRQLYSERKLDRAQAWFWSEERPAEELYDLRKDPHELHNLANDPAYRGDLLKMRGILEQWIRETGDKGQQPESDAGLRAVMKQWRKRCVNPEYDRVRTEAAK